LFRSWSQRDGERGERVGGRKEEAVGPGSGKEGGEVGRGGNKKLKYEKKNKEKKRKPYPGRVIAVDNVVAVHPAKKKRKKIKSIKWGK
jgi:hypothetical protein